MDAIHHSQRCSALNRTNPTRPFSVVWSLLDAVQTRSLCAGQLVTDIGPGCQLPKFQLCYRHRAFVSGHSDFRPTCYSRNEARKDLFVRRPQSRQPTSTHRWLLTDGKTMSSKGIHGGSVSSAGHKVAVQAAKHHGSGPATPTTIPGTTSTQEVRGAPQRNATAAKGIRHVPSSATATPPSRDADTGGRWVGWQRTCLCGRASRRWLMRWRSSFRSHCPVSPLYPPLTPCASTAPVIPV